MYMYSLLVSDIRNPNPV